MILYRSHIKTLCLPVEWESISTINTLSVHEERVQIERIAGQFAVWRDRISEGKIHFIKGDIATMSYYTIDLNQGPTRLISRSSRLHETHHVSVSYAYEVVPTLRKLADNEKLGITEQDVMDILTGAPIPGFGYYDERTG